MATASKNKPSSITTLSKSKDSDREIDGIIYEAEKTLKKVKQTEDDFTIMQNEANMRCRHVEYSPLENCVGKVIISPWCTPETLDALVRSDARPHTIRQLAVW